jgi:hypothetical protein
MKDETKKKIKIWLAVGLPIIASMALYASYRNVGNMVSSGMIAVPNHDASVHPQADESQPKMVGHIKLPSGCGQVIQSGKVTGSEEGFIIDRRGPDHLYHVVTLVVSGFDAVWEISDPDAGRFDPKEFKAGHVNKMKMETVLTTAERLRYRVSQPGNSPTVMEYVVTEN